MVLSGVAYLASKSHFSNPCYFRDMTFFFFFQKNSKNLNFKELHKLKDIVLVVGNCESTLRSCELASENYCSNPCTFFRYDVLKDFFKKNDCSKPCSF